MNTPHAHSSARGFTLIELLVVIAIIGILSSVVLAALNSSRAKGNVAAMKQDLAHIRTQAELDYDAKGCYSTGSCTTADTGHQTCAAAVASTADTAFLDTKINAMITGALANGGAASDCRSYTNNNSYAVSILYANDSTKSWCVDSTGNAKEEVVDSNGINSTIQVSGTKIVCK